MSTEMRPFHEDITDEMWEKVDLVIENWKDRPGATIPALRECQDIVGYLPGELIDYISTGLNIPKSEVFGVASFYSLFSLKPKGRHTIKMCMGTACYVKGVKEVKNHICNHLNLESNGTTDDRRFSLEDVRCVGACGLAPVMVVNEDTHGSIKSEQVQKILDEYK